MDLVATNGKAKVLWDRDTRVADPRLAAFGIHENKLTNPALDILRLSVDFKPKVEGDTDTDLSTLLW